MKSIFMILSAELEMALCTLQASSFDPTRKNRFFFPTRKIEGDSARRVEIVEHKLETVNRDHEKFEFTCSK